MSVRCPLCWQELPVDSRAEVRLEDAARVLNVSESYVERMLERDELPHRTVKLAGSYKVVLIPMAELVRLRLENIAKMETALNSLGNLDPDDVDLKT